LFVELPRTGSTAISKELIQNYGGQQILKKHATYRDFLKKASDEEKSYFAFSSIRDPMDKILSLYFKYKTDHREYDNPETFRRSNALITNLMQSQYNFVTKNDASFPEFFKRFYFLPYDDWSSLDHRKMDYVIRFENLAEDFETALDRIGLACVRPLPVMNKTASRTRDFTSYYSPNIRRRAEWVFASYYRRWGYKFPEDWDLAEFRSAEPVFRFANLFRNFYWLYLR
jgi:hypothetical protein